MLQGGLGGSSTAAAAQVVPPPSTSIGGGDYSPSSVEAAAAGGDGVGSNSGEEDRGGITATAGGELELGNRSFGGNRWPRQETFALLKIRSDMDVAFRDASVKGPLWEQVSRKLAELGYNRSAKKCKEKFENVYKYHKRTKEGRTGKSEGKTYRFFDQLEALDQNHPNPNPIPINTCRSSIPPSSIANMVPQLPQPNTAIPVQMPLPHLSNTTTTAATTAPIVPHVVSTVPSTTLPMSMTIQPNIHATTPSALNLTSFPSTFPSSAPNQLPPSAANPPPPHSQPRVPSSFPSIPADFPSGSTSSSTSSDRDFGGRRKRKRKWKEFFERLMKGVIEKQEELQKRFLEAMEKQEHERAAREESWRAQEMARINREREILAQERSMAAAKEAAVMTFLQKIGDQQNIGQVFNNSINNISVPQTALTPPTQPPVIASQLAPPPPTHQHQPPAVFPMPISTAPQPQAVSSTEITKTGSGDNENATPASSSRWPKVEVQALIKLRTDLDIKYQESGPKGPLWEEISAGMRSLGYNRSAKRCKEKWENINKYFKKVKESNKKRPEDSKTCPYFRQLDALYREKNKFDHQNNVTSSGNDNTITGNNMKPENTMTPLMVRPEQQWPPQQETRAGPGLTMADMEMHNPDGEEEEDEEERDAEEEEEEEDEDEGGTGGKPTSAE